MWIEPRVITSGLFAIIRKRNCPYAATREKLSNNMEDFKFLKESTEEELFQQKVTNSSEICNRYPISSHTPFSLSMVENNYKFHRSYIIFRIFLF